MSYGNWQRRAVEWFNAQTGGTSAAFADAAAEYYFKASSGEIPAAEVPDGSITAAKLAPAVNTAISDLETEQQNQSNQIADHEARIAALETP